MKRLIAWPAQLPASLAGLYDEIAAQLRDTEVVPLEALTDIESARSGGGFSGPDAVVAVVDAFVMEANADVATVVRGLDALVQQANLEIVAVVGDGALGTDMPELASAQSAAAAISTVRSIAVRRNHGGCANVVCVPDALFGNVSSQRAPLAQATERDDVANAVAFFLGKDSNYISGQVLFVDGGRHLFSSMTA